MSSHSSACLLISSLKLLRNLCAGEIKHQDLFIKQRGVDIVSNVVSAGIKSDSGNGIIRIGLQVRANVSLAGEKHQQAIWHHLYPNDLLQSQVSISERLDPLYMIIYTSCICNPELVSQFCADSGLPLFREIMKSASTVGFGEDWLKLLLSKICLEAPYFSPLFSYLVAGSSNGEKTELHDASSFSSEQAFILRIVSEIVNERIREFLLLMISHCIYSVYLKALLC